MNARSDRQTGIYASLFFALVSMIMTAMNIAKQYWFMAGTTTLLVIGFLVAALFSFREKTMIARSIVAVLSSVVFSIYAITGENNGFAILWILMVPMLSTMILGMRLGFFMSLYFQLFLIVLFYSPLSVYVKEHYTATFMMRFPVLYFASFGVILYLMIQRQDLFNEVRYHAFYDVLTGLYNRNYCQEFEKEAEKYENLSIVMIDLNRLKHINDTIGHEAGDEMLRGAAAMIAKAFDGDTCCRTGGDEFLIICNRNDIDESLRKLSGMEKEWKGIIVSELSMSVGYARRKEHPDLPFQELSKVADQNMYMEKRRYYQQTGFDRRQD